jgi:hypothetical protein
MVLTANYFLNFPVVWEFGLQFDAWEKREGISTEASEYLSPIMGGKNKTMPDILLDIEEIRHGVDCTERGINPIRPLSQF